MLPDYIQCIGRTAAAQFALDLKLPYPLNPILSTVATV